MIDLSQQSGTAAEQTDLGFVAQPVRGGAGGATPRTAHIAPTLLERVRLLQGTSFFTGLRAEHLVDLAAETQVVTFSAGDHILPQDGVGAGDYVYVVIDGTVQAITRSHKEGVVNEVVTGWLSAGDAIGELLILGGLADAATGVPGPHQGVSLIALVTTDCLRIPRDLVLHGLRRHWPLQEAFVRRLVARVQQAESRLAELDCDPLTGLSSRHAAAQFYERHAALCRRAAHAGLAVAEGAADGDTRRVMSVSVVVATVPGYLRLAEEHGRPKAESLLGAVAAALSASASRTTDLVARYGLAEFVAVLPQSAAAGAAVVLERTRTNLRKLTAGCPPFSLQLGIATADLAASESLGALVTRASRSSGPR